MKILTLMFILFVNLFANYSEEIPEKKTPFNLIEFLILNLHNIFFIISITLCIYLSNSKKDRRFIFLGVPLCVIIALFIKIIILNHYNLHIENLLNSLN